MPVSWREVEGCGVFHVFVLIHYKDKTDNADIARSEDSYVGADCNPSCCPDLPIEGLWVLQR